MHAETIKLNIIASLINENDEAVLKDVEKILTNSKSWPASKFENFSNALSESELNDFEQIIKDGCEQINQDDWK